MTRVIAIAGIVVGTLVAALLGLRPQEVRGGNVASPERQDGKPLRLGVFESRAIAIAYTPSRFNTEVKKLMEESKAAQAKGDTKRVEELKKEGSRLQDRLHRQGFGKASVDDLLEPIKGSFPDDCKAAGVDAIVTASSTRAPASRRST